uniref:Uncharacterized protein n=1 Tax=Timema bartmani TaxID=61472 RepID=A0A7R9ENL8_9NEOP|nr:unnamed protein product [Timema bartmani]
MINMFIFALPRQTNPSLEAKLEFHGIYQAKESYPPATHVLNHIDSELREAMAADNKKEVPIAGSRNALIGLAKLQHHTQLYPATLTIGTETSKRIIL